MKHWMRAASLSRSVDIGGVCFSRASQPRRHADPSSGEGFDPTCVAQATRPDIAAAQFSTGAHIQLQGIAIHSEVPPCLAN